MSPWTTCTSTRRRSSWSPILLDSTSSSPTTSSATSSPIWPARSAAASDSRPRATSTPTARSRRCSSRCTVRRPTSRGSRRPTPPPRSCPIALLLDHLGLHGRRPRRVDAAVDADIAERGDAHAARPPRSATRSSRALSSARRSRPSAPEGRSTMTHQPAAPWPPRTGLCSGRSPATTPPKTDAERDDDPRRPRLRQALHRPHGRHLLVGEGRLAPPARAAVRPDLARPGRRGAALRAGDLRGAQGLPPRRRLDLDLPPRRRTRRACSARPRASRCPSCRREYFIESLRAAHRRRRRLGADRRRDRACTCARSCSRRRRSSACAPRRRSTTT